MAFPRMVNLGFHILLIVQTARHNLEGLHFAPTHLVSRIVVFLHLEL